MDLGECYTLTVLATSCDAITNCCTRRYGTLRAISDAEKCNILCDIELLDLWYGRSDYDSYTTSTTAWTIVFALTDPAS